MQVDCCTIATIFVLVQPVESHDIKANRDCEENIGRTKQATHKKYCVPNRVANKAQRTCVYLHDIVKWVPFSKAVSFGSCILLQS